MDNSPLNGHWKGRIPVFAGKNFIFLPFLLLLVLFMVLVPEKIVAWPEFIDWQTIINLTGLLLVVTAIKESAFIGRFSKKLLTKTKTERSLAFSLVALSGILSMFLTNDIALFITIPLTLEFRDLIKNDVKKLIIFQAIAVNTGSALTPVGNPQNLFLWHQWGVSFFGFIEKMFPLFIVMFLVLAVFVGIFFPKKPLSFHDQPHKNSVNTRLFAVSVVLLVSFIASIELGWAFPALLIIAVLYLSFYRKIFIKTDWMLLLLFVVMFIDFHLLGHVPLVIRFVDHFNMAHPVDSFVSSVLFSQVMSNVPAAIFMSKFSTQWQAMAYGVNVGGNGLVLASLANIIALRFVNRRSIWIDFHKYSIPYLVATTVLVYLIFYL